MHLLPHVPLAPQAIQVAKDILKAAGTDEIGCSIFGNQRAVELLKD